MSLKLTLMLAGLDMACGMARSGTTHASYILLLSRCLMNVGSLGKCTREFRDHTRNIKNGTSAHVVHK